MTFETISEIIIKKIEEQCKDIIDKIVDRETSKNLQRIEIWIKQQINSKFLSHNIQLLAIIIDIIFQHIKNEANEKTTILIENCLINLIDNLGILSEKKILVITAYLKVYAKTNDADAQSGLENFIASLAQSKHNPVKYRKNFKARIIEFDEDGIGYDISSLYLYLKEIKRLNNINLEIELSNRIKKELLQKELFNEELERLAGIEVYGPDVNKLERIIKINDFALFASQEEKDAKQRYIEEKIENTKKFWRRHRSKQKKEAKVKKINKLLKPELLIIRKEIDSYKKAFDFQSLSLGLPSLMINKGKFLAAFIKTINYEKFKKLIMFSEYILIIIAKMKETFRKIDDFSQGLGIDSNYIECLDNYYREIKKNFNRESISNFLEKALVLFEQKTLALDNNYCLLDIQIKQKEILFSEPDFLNEFISANNNEKIFQILFDDIKHFLSKKRKNLNIIIEKNYKNSLIKKLFFYLSEEYYFVSEKCKKKLMKKIVSNASLPLSLESIRVSMSNLQLWQFFLIGISVICIVKKRFRARLAEELFLESLDEIFKNIDKEPNPKSIDVLYSIQNHIKPLNNKIQDDSIGLYSLNVLDSRQAIVDRLKNYAKIKDLINKLLILSNQVSSCINGFYNLKKTCRRESEKVQFDFCVTNYFSNISKNSETSQLNENNERNLCFFSGKR